jgi:hypothetical protein
MSTGISHANNALWPNQLDESILDRTRGIALGVGLNVAQVTDMTFLIFGSTVGLIVWVD